MRPEPGRLLPKRGALLRFLPGGRRVRGAFGQLVDRNNSLETSGR